MEVAIIGTGQVGGLAEKFLSNNEATYISCEFIDVNKEKVGREIYEILVLSENEATSAHGNVKYNVTCFGNVLESAGFVIPLYKRQMANE